MKERILRFNLYIGIVVLFFAEILLFLNVPFMKTWFFCFAWWSFILIIDSLNLRRTKHSPLFDSCRDFLFTVFISVCVWLIFELFNLRLRNWSYHSLPPQFWQRWLGYFLSFASVIPALKELSSLIESFLGRRKIRFFSIRVTPFFLRACVVLGVISLILTLSFPRICFPLVWLCFIFLLDPVNYWLKNRSFLRDIEENRWNSFFSWVLAGLGTGILWELWNFWAGSHWQYSLPYFSFWKIFQMPVLGYLGFMPFAIEIFAIHQFFSWLYKKQEKKVYSNIVLFVLLVIFSLGCFYLIDTFSLV